jgi:integrase
MAHRVSKGGTYRIDRCFPPPVGRLAVSSGASTLAVFRQADACLMRLAERGRLDVLAAVKQGAVTVPQVLAADRSGKLDGLVASLTPSPEQALLWAAVQSWLGPVSDRGPTAKRYGVSWAKLERLGLLPTDARVADLATVEWRTVSRRWEASPADHNLMRRAVGRFLTCQLGDVYHPLRRAVMRSWKPLAEQERVPDLDVPTFWQVVHAAPEHVRAAFVAIVALGLRVGEYLRLHETDLHPLTKTVSIPGTKTAGSAAVLKVDPEMWPWVTAAVPAPVTYGWLRRYWKRALKTAGADTDLRLHDLRHLTAQVLVNAGQSEASVQTTMRHATPSMTRRYAKQRDHGENAAALARVLLDVRSA